jgi:hypothetical protein
MQISQDIFKERNHDFTLCPDNLFHPHRNFRFADAFVQENSYQNLALKPNTGRNGKIVNFSREE